MELREDSILYSQNTPKSYLKNMGQFFTKAPIRDKLLSVLPKMDHPVILEPSFGTGEFLDSLLRIYKGDAHIVGIEKDKKLFQMVNKRIIGLDLRNQDFLTFDHKNKYDLVIGNPPYFEMSLTKDLDKRFGDVISGRPNIYSFFIKLGIEALKPNGYLAFVLPASICSGAYFAALRSFIIAHTNIDYVEIFDDDNLFEKASQRIILLVLRKTKNKGHNCFKFHEHNFITPEAKSLEQIFKGKQRLKDLGYRVKTGSIVWNQKKDLLTNDNSHQFLLWAKNIDGGKIQVKNMESPKGQYIKLKTSEPYPSIVVNRVIGNASAPEIRAAIQTKPFLAENHVNVIYPGQNPQVSLESIYEKLVSEEMREVVSMLIGNTQLSKTEIEKILPF